MTPISKAVLITGCSSGIGEATAIRLARGGWTVYASARRPGSIAHLEAEGCRVLALDVTDEASMEAAVRTVEEAEGAVGVLVNNAAYSQSGAVETVAMESARAQFETNVFGLLRLTQLVLPGMRRQGWGKVVNVSSMGGRLTLPGGGMYHATKYAVEAISDALRFEVQGFGVDVVLIEPGLIRTGFAEVAAKSVDEGKVPGDGPYAAFNAQVAQVTEEAYEGPFGRLGGDADAVAVAIEKAIGRRRSPTRKTVTPSAKVFLGTRALLPDRLWDRFLRSTYTPPT